MRIAFLSPIYPFRGGIAHSSGSLFKAFKKHGHEVKAFTFSRQYPDLLFPGTSQFVPEEDITDPIESHQILDSINPISYLTAATKIADWEPDILIMRFWMPFFGPSLGTVAGRLKNKGVKVISILDNVIPHEKRPGDQLLTKYFLKRSNGFVVMGESVKNDLLKLFPGASYIHYPHPLYDSYGEKMDQKEARAKLNIPAGKKLLLFFGLVREYKGLDFLLKAVSQLPEDYFLLVGGEVYGDENYYHELVEKYDLQDRVQLNFRYIDDREIPVFFSAADVNILPYKSATQSGILAIALHFELPVIVTDVGSLKELVEPHEMGLVVPKVNPELIRETILKFFSDNEKLRFQENIRKFKDQISWEGMAGKIAEFSATL